MPARTRVDPAPAGRNRLVGDHLGSPGPRQFGHQRLDLAAQRRVVGRVQPELNLGAAGRHLQRFANERQGDVRLALDFAPAIRDAIAVATFSIAVSEWASHVCRA